MMTEAQGFRLRIAGLGGQGVVSLASAISWAAVKSGVNVTCLERLRSAMRLGPVICELRLGGEGFTPTQAPGTVDAVLGLEPYEGGTSAGQLLRYGGHAIINTHQTPPIASVVKGTPYPDLEPVWGHLRERDADLVFVDATEMARTVTGKPTGANYLLLGLLVSRVKAFPIPEAALRAAIGSDAAKIGCFELGLNYRG